MGKSKEQSVHAAKAAKISAECRELPTLPDKVRFLRAQGFSFSVIGLAFDVPRTTVIRWAKNETATNRKGRPPALTAAQGFELQEIVKKSAQAHTPHNITSLRAEVSTSTSACVQRAVKINPNFHLFPRQRVWLGAPVACRGTGRRNG